jgi:hypothetical protein
MIRHYIRCATPTPATVNSPNSSTAQTLLDAPLAHPHQQLRPRLPSVPARHAVAHGKSNHILAPPSRASRFVSKSRVRGLRGRPKPDVVSPCVARGYPRRAPNVPFRGTRYHRPVTRSRRRNSHRITALIGCPIIAPRTRQANTVRDRVMRCLMDESTHHTSPEVWRGSVRSRPQLSSGCEAAINRSDVPIQSGLRVGVSGSVLCDAVSALNDSCAGSRA